MSTSVFWFWGKWAILTFQISSRKLPPLVNLLPVASSKTAQLLSLLLGHGSGSISHPSVPQRSQVPLRSHSTSDGALWLGKTWQTAFLFVDSVIPSVDQGWTCWHIGTLGKKWCAGHSLGCQPLPCLSRDGAEVARKALCHLCTFWRWRLLWGAGPSRAWEQPKRLL